MFSRRILVFAPHPDDEVIGCGGYLAAQVALGARVTVVVVSDGAAGLAGAVELWDREAESRDGLTELGISDVRFWAHPDGAVPLSGPIAEAYRSAVVEIRPAEILLPNPQESHPDHQRVTRGVLKALEGRWEGVLLFYETSQPAAVFNFAVDVTETFAAKECAMRAHGSQMFARDYVGYIGALATLRGELVEGSRGEVFLRFDWDGTPQNFFETQPLISVVVRAEDPLFLRYALSSLYHQNYPMVEVVVVWFGEGEPSLKGFEQLDLRWIPGVRSRPHNLNLGVAAATGEYIAFLDQDDVLFPDHFANLLAALHGNPSIDGVYSGYRMVACVREGERIVKQRVVEEQNRPWREVRILFGNVLPNHTLLFRANLFRGRRFDETLEAYEDWDLLARLVLADYRFEHVDAVSCEYRVFDVEEGAGRLEVHAGKGYLEWNERVVEKIVAGLTPAHYHRLMRLNEDVEGALEEFATKADAVWREEGRLRRELERYRRLERMQRRALRALEGGGSAGDPLQRLIVRSLPVGPLFSVILPTFNSDVELLRAALDSLGAQSYGGWELCLVDDGSTDAAVGAFLDALADDERWGAKAKIHRSRVNQGIVDASNRAVSMATAPFLLFLDHDDRLQRDALLWLALEFINDDAVDLVYADSILIDHAGVRLHTQHKSDWAPETLLTHNYINHPLAIRSERLAAVGGLDKRYDGVQDWAMLLALVADGLRPEEVRHVPVPLYEWRATSSSVAYSMEAKPWLRSAACLLLEGHLRGRGLSDVSVQANPLGAGFVAEWAGERPAVDVVVPTHSNFDALRRCIEGLFDATDYSALRVIVVAHRASDEVRRYLADAVARWPITVIEDDGPFNWSRLVNRGADAGSGACLLALNDDVEMVDHRWLARMVRYLDLEGVGIVGAMLYYPTGEVQHNGIRLEPGGGANNIVELGDFGHLAVSRNVSAVTGACMLLRRELWQDLGGFDEAFAVSFNDVDFCLRGRHAGWRVVQAADVELIHHEHGTLGDVVADPGKRARLDQEVSAMRERWGEALEERYLPVFDVEIRSTRLLRLPTQGGEDG